MEKFALVGGGSENQTPDGGVDGGVQSTDRPTSASNGNGKGGDAETDTPDSQITSGSSWRDDRDRLLDRLFAWKTGEAWREVVLVCGAERGCGFRGGGGRGLRSACELEVRQGGVASPAVEVEECPSAAPERSASAQLETTHTVPQPQLGTVDNKPCVAAKKLAAAQS